MTFTRLVLKNLRYHRRAAVATALCVAVAVAVLAGALIVGDSVRWTLRHLALARLGPYDEVLVTEQPFRAALARELAATPGFHEHFTAAVPVLLLRGTIEHSGSDGTRRASGVTIIGCDQDFWTASGSSSPSFPPPQLKTDGVALNSALAAPEQLGVGEGASVLLRIGRSGGIPADSPLGQKERSETVASRELTVAAVIPNKGLGHFTLNPTQQSSLCAFVDLATLQKMLDQPQRANAILLAGQLNADTASAAQWNAQSVTGSEWLAAHLPPKIEDFGLKLRRIVIGDAARPVNDYFNLTADRMLLSSEVERAAAAAWRDLAVQPALTFLANDLEHNGKHIPYSTISAIDSAASLGPLNGADGKPLATIKDNEIVLVDWAANELGAKPGDTIQVAYFDPETTHGEPRERTVALTLKAIVPLAAHDAPPLKTNDPDLTPELKGMTDSKSIGKWLVPFELKRPIRPQDDQYWTDRRTTPKAYVSLATGRNLWGSRFGQTTSLRVAPAAGLSEQALRERLAAEIKPERMGLAFRPVKRDALQSATGTTPFDVLLLLFSLFLIGAVLMLLAVLFQLGIDQRASEIGLLAAIGIRRRTILRMLLAEAIVAAALGSALGTLLAIGYAWLMLTGLRTGWLSSISSPQLILHVTPLSLFAGSAAGLLVAALTIFAAVRRIGRIPVRRLLAGVALLDQRRAERKSKQRGSCRLASSGMVVTGILAIVAILCFAGFIGAAESQAGLFFASGALTLVAGLLGIRALLNRTHIASATRLSLPWLAARNAMLNPRRSLLCVGLMATVAFLIIATGAFRQEVSDSGSGGFNVLAQNPLPIFHDLSTPPGRAALGITGSDDALLAQCTVAALRVHDGDDASCLNLYRPRQPRILGVPPTLAEQCRGANRFAWAAARDVTNRTSSRAANDEDAPWWLLDPPLPDRNGAARIPVILDENTARYSLGEMGVAPETIDIFDTAGNKVTLEVVALLRNSVFQGDLLISERNLLKLFPDTRGYRYFLVRTPPGQTNAVVHALEDRLGDFGIDATLAHDRLAELLAVQNTYLSTFQALGGLGLLLGTLGLAAVQLRSVLERRGELALLRAEGFARRRIAALVLYEIAALMLVGLGIGTLAALVAIWPHFFAGAARCPWLPLVGTLLAVVACGLTAGLAAVRAAVSIPLMPALRGE